MLKTISAVVVALATGVVGAVLGYMSRDREMDVKMVEIAVGILSKDPEAGIAPAREWAVDVIDGYSEVKVSQAARNALVNYKAVGLGWVDTYVGYEPYYKDYGGYNAYDDRTSQPPVTPP